MRECVAGCARPTALKDRASSPLYLAVSNSPEVLYQLSVISRVGPSPRDPGTAVDPVLLQLGKNVGQRAVVLIFSGIVESPG